MPGFYETLEQSMGPRAPFRVPGFDATPPAFPSTGFTPAPPPGPPTGLTPQEAGPTVLTTPPTMVPFPSTGFTPTIPGGFTSKFTPDDVLNAKGEGGGVQPEDIIHRPSDTVRRWGDISPTQIKAIRRMLQKDSDLAKRVAIGDDDTSIHGHPEDLAFVLATANGMNPRRTVEVDESELPRVRQLAKILGSHKRIRISKGGPGIRPTVEGSNEDIGDVIRGLPSPEEES